MEDTLGSRVRTTRMRRVLDQQRLAELAGVSNVTVSRIENGYYAHPRMATVRKLAIALDVDPAWLMYGDEDRLEKTAA
jgi:transcriptional regulator with XRE-family HTH domain